MFHSIQKVKYLVLTTATSFHGYRGLPERAFRLFIVLCGQTGPGTVRDATLLGPLLGPSK